MGRSYIDPVRSVKDSNRSRGVSPSVRALRSTATRPGPSGIGRDRL